jgi:hypothetical protein
MTTSCDTKMLLKVVFYKIMFVKFKINNNFKQNIDKIIKHIQNNKKTTRKSILAYEFKNPKKKSAISKEKTIPYGFKIYRKSITKPGGYKEMSFILADQWRPSYMSLNAGKGGGGCGVSANENSGAHHVTWSPTKLWRSGFFFFVISISASTPPLFITFRVC